MSVSDLPGVIQCVGFLVVFLGGFFVCVRDCEKKTKKNRKIREKMEKSRFGLRISEMIN